MPKQGKCAVCKCVKKIVADRRCMACYQYRRRKGYDRDDVVLAEYGNGVLCQERAYRADPTLLLTTTEGRERIRQALLARRAG